MFRRSSKKDILNGNILEQMMLFFFPVFMGYLLQMFYGFADSVVLGRFIGKEALASVGGSANSIINIILNCVSGLTAAITVRVAQSYGKGNMEKASNVVKTGMFVSISFGAFLTVLMITISPFLLRLMGTPEETISTSLIYLRFYFGSMVFYFVYQSGVSILRALGDSKRPLMLIMVTAVCKIGFDLLLAGILKLGVFGTSMATFLSHLVCALVILFIFYHTSDIYQFSLKELRFDKEEVIEIFKVGIPFAIQSMMFAIPSAFILSKINSFGTDAIAAYSAFSNVDNVFWCFSNSVSTSTITMASQNYGHGNLKRVRLIALTSILVEASGALIFGLAFQSYGKNLLSLFLTDAEPLEISWKMLRIISMSYILYVFVEPMSAMFKSCGLIRTPMIIAIFTICFMRIGFITLFPMSEPQLPVFAFPLSWVVTSFAYLNYYIFNDRFKDKKVNKGPMVLPDK